MADIRTQNVGGARQRFFAEGVLPSGDLVPAPILRSWQRCASMGLHRLPRPRLEPVTEAELRRIAERHDRLRRVCRPELEALHGDAQDSDSIVILTDADGLVLDSVGSRDFATRAARVALRPGVAWGEGHTGTNAIGTALVERRGVEVRGAEHFFDDHRILTCAAVPIRGPRGDVLGALDLSGPAGTGRSHALALVRLAVDQIEHRLFAEGFEDADVLRLHPDPALLGTPREGVLVFEADRLIAANRHALALFGLDWDALGQIRRPDLLMRGAGDTGADGAIRTRDGRVLRARPVPRPMALPRAVPLPAPIADGLVLDAAAQAQIRRAVRLLDANLPVTILGETGTGKEVFARAVHAASVRRAGPFVAINCAALPESLIEAELFGHEPGAFTGARKQGAPGLLRQAQGGVLFLDEIGDMPLSLQARLLRVLQEREVTPLGGGKPVAVDFAVLCATHRDLNALVATGRFRADLQFRLAQYPFHLPPLRAHADRAAVIAALWRQAGGEAAGLTLTDSALAHLAGYDWPGNFRQVTGTLRAMIALAEPGQNVDVDMLPPLVRQAVPVPAQASAPAADAALDRIELDAMRAALDASGGNVTHAARRLGISRSTLYRRLLAKSGEDTRPV